tara:strand:+ start:13350 stop:16670 length:3321 start_codon:yes stop_codon:yes gene_type:complete
MPTFYPKKTFQLSGSNMDFVEKVFFGDDLVSPIAYLDTTGISGFVPNNAKTSSVRVHLNDDILDLGVQNVVLDSDSQVLVSGLLPRYVSGEIGSIIQLSGENFYRITDVNFGDVSSEFSVISPNLLEAIVPSGAVYDQVTVFSSERTGLNNNQTIPSGKTYNKFIPLPKISGLSSGQLRQGQELTFGGVALSGVTGVKVNNILFSNYISLGSTGFKATVPTGNTRGVPELMLESGQIISGDSEYSFKPAAEIVGVQQGRWAGQIARISGYNFNSGLFHTGEGDGTGCLVSFEGQTGNFKIISDAGGYNRLEGHVPVNIPLVVSGGNISAGVSPTIVNLDVSLFSQDFPEQYPSRASFRPSIKAPVITGVSPASGVGNTSITIQGTDFFGITGVNLRAGNIGGGETVEQGIVSNFDGTEIQATVPDTSSFSTAGGFISIDISGYYGYHYLEDIYFVLGTPNVSKVIPDTDVLPGSTGTMYGSRLYSGSQVRLYNNNLAPVNYRGEIMVSGYTTGHDEIIFNFPNSFETGNNYKLRVTNDRASSPLSQGAFTALYSPDIATITPISGEFESPVVVSGYFEGIKPSGLKIGNRIVSTYTQTSTTGISFNIPQNTKSDYLNISTSGGEVSSSGILNISPNKPTISGFYIGEGEIPSSFSSDQVFKAGDTITVTGQRMHLVTGVLFSGENYEFSVNNFAQQNPTVLSFAAPQGVNSGSGEFILSDTKSRRVQSPSSINEVTLSGYSDHLLPDEYITFSGNNCTGLSLNFTSLTGGAVSVEATVNDSTVVPLQTKFKVPTGIVDSTLTISGRGNTFASEVLNFQPLGVISGVSGVDVAGGYTIDSGNLLNISGINVNNTYSSGSFSVGVSGTGNAEGINKVHFYETSGVETGTTSEGDLITRVGIRVDDGFVGTGQLFVVSPWETSIVEGSVDENDYDNSTLIRGTSMEAKLPQIINKFPQEYKIQGTQVNVNSFGPQRGPTGTAVSLTGAGLKGVRQVFFDVPSGERFEADFTVPSDNKIITTVPEEAIEARGMTNILLSGATNFTVKDFEVVLDASVVEFNIVEENDVPASSTRVGNFTQKETIGGVVFLVTRTRFPDGTTAVVSSVPEG